MGDAITSTVVGGLAGMTLSVVVALVCVVATDDRATIYAEALEAGAGEYYLDEHHEKQWRWITPETTNTQEANE